jgi:hypothetical protein
MRTINNERGVTLMIGLMLVIVLVPLTGVIVLRTVNESVMVKKNQDMTKAFYVAEAGSQAGLEQLDTLINTQLFTTINAMNPASVISNAQSNLNDGVQFLIVMVKDNGVAQLTLNDAQAEYASANTSFGNGTYQYDIFLTEKSDPVTVSQDIWDFPYNYRIESTGSFGSLSSKILLTGDFTVRVQRDSFARYALFTNQQTLPNGTTNVWFTSKTNFAGPIHTNGRYNIYGNPSGTFDGIVAQKEQTARFYNNGLAVLLDADYNGTLDVPTLNAGFERGEDAITLSSNVQKEDLIEQADGGQTFSGNGIFVPNNGASVTGGIYINGDSTVNLSVDGNNNAVYTIVQGAATDTITVDKINNQTTVAVSGGATTTYTGIPDGVDNMGTIIFANGNITDLAGTVQADTELTISSEHDIVIGDHVRYADYTPAVGSPGDAGYVPPNADDATNLLGLVSWAGDVRVATSAPDDVDVHGTILAQSGIFTVDHYNDYGAGPRGEATLLGGAISDFYGAFGLFSSSTGDHLTGYGRNFVYDTRMQGGKTPPYFPTLNAFIGFTNDIADKVVLQVGG